jgi:putative glycosyltransferase (TIGR04372 family)
MVINKETLSLAYGFLSYILILIISPIIKIRIGELESRAIGHFSISIEIYLSEIELGIHKKDSRNYDIFYFNKIKCNEFLVKKWSEHFRIGNRKYLEPVFLFLMQFNPTSRHLVPIKNWRNTRRMFEDQHGALKKTSPHIIFNRDEEEHGKKLLEALGVSHQDKIVLFHARDPNFREGSNALPGHRDSSSWHQQLAMLEMVERGYKVIRVGRNVRDKLSIDNINIIDYSCSVNQSDFMDIYLLKRCHFMVCNGSGLELVGLIFRKPLVCVSLAEWRFFDCFTSTQYPLFIPKKYFFKKTGLPLSLVDIQKIGCNSFTSKENYDNAGIYVEDNTPEEIRDVVSEMADLFENNHNLNCTNLQTKFSEIVHLRDGRKIPFTIGKKYIEQNKYLID